MTTTLETTFDGLPTLQLGSLEGVWAVIYGRRVALEKQFSAQFDPVMNSLAGLDWETVLGVLISQQLINPDVQGVALAATLMVSVEQLITGLPADDLVTWRTVMTGALVDAQAEGAATGIALLAHPVGIDWELAGTEAKQALAGAQWVDDQAATWVAKQTHGLGYQVGQKLADLWDQNASKSDMLTAIRDILGSSENNARLLLDHAISKSLSAGALSTYNLAQVQMVDFLTAGDVRVCTTCQAAEDNSPYKRDHAPHPGLHVRCRCSLSPSGTQLTSAGQALINRYTE